MKTTLEYVGIGYNKTILGPLDVWINVYSPELNPGADGDQMNPVSTIDIATVGIDDNHTVGKATISGHVRAKWLPVGSNRFTAPSLQVGERVELYKESDTGRYLWSSLGLDEGLRKLETIVFGISASDKPGVTGRDPNNMYWFEISSHSQKIALSTSQHLGEKAAYQFYFDLAAGKVVLNDNVGNEISLESLAEHIKLMTASGAYSELVKKNITHKAIDNLKLIAGKDITIQAGTTLTMSAKSGTTLTTPQFKGVK